MNTDKKLALLGFTAIAALAILLTGAALVATGNLTIFEDGSWMLGTYAQHIGGCLPFAICN